MEIVKKLEDIASLKENRIITGEGLTLKNTTITFRGKGNLFYAEDGILLDGCNITFFGDNALIYLSRSDRPYKLSVSSYHDTTLYFGTNNFFNQKMIVLLAEHQNVVVGNAGTFSSGIRLQTGDPHPIYSTVTKERVNASQSIFVGDHVWLAQNTTLLKGSVIGSGSILDEQSVVRSSTVPSNTYWCGNPAVQSARDVFFTGSSNYNWTEAQTSANKENKTGQFIYEEDGLPHNSLEKIDILLKCQTSAEDRLEQVQLLLASCTDKNRFFIPCPETSVVKASAAASPSRRKLFGRK